MSNEDMEIDADGHVNYKKTCSSTDTSTSNTPKTSSQVESSWEQRKQMERDGNKTVLSGVPDALPSIIKAYRIQDKARNVGFDWKKPADVWEKVREELGELETELENGDKDRSTTELGDFIFSVINAARLYHLNPDNALERAELRIALRLHDDDGRTEQQ